MISYDLLSRSEGQSSPLSVLHKWYANGYMSMSSRLNLGQNIFKSDWDLAVVLDACRVDTMEAMKTEFEFINDVTSVRSVGTVTTEWIANTFVEEYVDEIGSTTYISANFQSGTVLDERNFPPGEKTFISAVDWSDTVESDALRRFERVWDTDYEREYGTVRPEPVTDRAIHAGRNENPDRLLVHYLQPHLPYIGSDELVKDPKGDYYSGRRSIEELRSHYRNNLKCVLDSVKTLLSNVDAERAVITADHGELLGELGLYGHPGGVAHPVTTRVPWVETTAVDTGSRDPDIQETENAEEVSTEEMLEALGYLS